MKVGPAVQKRDIIQNIGTKTYSSHNIPITKPRLECFSWIPSYVLFICKQKSGTLPPDVKLAYLHVKEELKEDVRNG